MELRCWLEEQRSSRHHRSQTEAALIPPSEILLLVSRNHWLPARARMCNSCSVCNRRDRFASFSTSKLSTTPRRAQSRAGLIRGRPDRQFNSTAAARPIWKGSLQDINGILVTAVSELDHHHHTPTARRELTM